MSGEPDQVRWRGVRPVYGIRGVWPAIDAERVHASSFRDGLGSNIIYTPAAGKIYFITGLVMASRLAVAAECYTRVWVRDVADAEVYRICEQPYISAGSLITPMSFFPALEIAAGYDLVSYSSHADLDLRCFTFGWLEDA